MALVLLALVEVAVRQIPPRRLIAYERGAPARISIRQHLQAFGPAEVCFIGSSRVELGIICPVAASIVREQTGREVSVANYASGGAQIAELWPLVQYMLRSGHPPPKLLLFGVDPEQVRGEELFNDRSAVFWNLREWWAARGQFGSGVDQFLPDVVRNEIGECYWTLRYRTRPLNLVKTMYRGRDETGILGEYQPDQTGPKGKRTLVQFPPDVADVRHHIETAHLVNGRYPFSQARAAMIGELIRKCERAGTRVVLFEVPNAEVFDRFLPQTVAPSFRRMMREVAEREGATFLSLEDLGLSFGDEEFSDPVHLNLAGAKRLTEAVVRRATVP